MAPIAEQFVLILGVFLKLVLACPPGTYKPVGYVGPCLNHTNCEADFHRHLLRTGTTEVDCLCGNCILMYIDPDGLDPHSFMTECISCDTFPQFVQDQYDNCNLVQKEKLDECQSKRDMFEDITIGIACVLALVLALVCAMVVHQMRRPQHPVEADDPVNRPYPHSNGHLQH